MSWLAGIGAAGVDAFSSALSSIFNNSAQKERDSKAYQRQVALLQMQQQFAERMANTAHQREVADLRKAGLNPILSATGGQGAVSPVVSAPSVSQGSKADFDFGSPGTTMLNAANLASSAKLNKELADKANADKAVSEATAKKINAEASVEQAKAKAVNKTESFLDGITNPQVWRDLVTDPNTWRGVKDFFTGSSSARQSVSSPRKVSVGDVVRNPERHKDYLVDYDSSMKSRGQHFRNNSNRRTDFYYDRDGMFNIIIRKPYVPLKKNK